MAYIIREVDMKKMFWILFFCMLAMQGAFGESVQEVLLQAYTCYQQKDFTKALSLYDSIESKDVCIEYNRGTCHYQCGDYMQALAHWQKSARNATFEELSRIHYNIDVVEKKLGNVDTVSVLHILEKKIH